MVIMTTRINGAARLFLLGAGVFAVQGEAPAESDYLVVDVGPVRYKAVGGVNQSGVACFSAGPTLHACRWSENGGVETLTTVSYSYTFAINADGAVVGQVSGQATLWSPSNEATPLGFLPGTGSESRALGINDPGVVVGTSGSSLSNRNKPFIWTEATGMRPVPMLGGANGVAHDINAAGHVVGGSKTAGSAYDHAFWWSGSDSDPPVDLTPTKEFGQALAVNAHDHVVGTWGPLANTPFIWDAVGGLRALGHGGSQAWARDINDSDLIVGSYQLSGSASHRACLWDGGGMAVDLNTLIPPGSGWVLTDAYAVNNRGEILGAGELDGEEHAFLLKPAASGPPVLVAEPHEQAGRLMISWPEQSGLVLEQSTNLLNWSPSGATVETIDGSSRVTVDPGAGGKAVYYRLSESE